MLNTDDLNGVPWQLITGVYIGDRPLPNIAAFDRLTDIKNADRVAALNIWIEPQSTCSAIMKYHGEKGLRRVLYGIARASVALEVSMQPRVRSAAEFLELV